MMVLVIVGLISSAVVLTLPKDKSALDVTAHTLAARLNAASEGGIVTGESRALGVSATGYGIYGFKAGQWTQSSAEQWPDATVTFTRDGVEVKLREELQPTIIFEPTGLSTPFQLRLDSGDEIYIIENSGTDKTMLERVQ